MNDSAFAHDIDWQKAVLVLAASQILHMLLIWFASWVMNRDTGTSLNAIKTYFSTIGLYIIGIGALLAGRIWVREHSDWLTLLIWYFVWGCAMIISYFALLMRIYDVGIPGALGIVIIIIPFNGFISYVMTQVTGVHFNGTGARPAHTVVSGETSRVALFFQTHAAWKICMKNGNTSSSLEPIL